MSKQLLTNPTNLLVAIPYRLVLLFIMIFTLLTLSSFDNLSENNKHSAQVVFNGEVNNEAKILRKVADLPSLLNEWVEEATKQTNFEDQVFVNQIKNSAYISGQLKPVLILDPHPSSSAPTLSKVYLAIFQLPENKFVQERLSFDKLPEIINSWNCSFSGNIKNKKELEYFEISRSNLNNYIAIPYGAQYEADMYWLLSNHELVYDKY